MIKFYSFYNSSKTTSSVTFKHYRTVICFFFNNFQSKIDLQIINMFLVNFANVYYSSTLLYRHFYNWCHLLNRRTYQRNMRSTWNIILWHRLYSPLFIYFQETGEAIKVYIMISQTQSRSFVTERLYISIKSNTIFFKVKEVFLHIINYKCFRMFWWVMYEFVANHSRSTLGKIPGKIAG